MEIKQHLGKRMITLDHVYTPSFIIELIKKKQKHRLYIGFNDFCCVFDNLPQVQLFQTFIETEMDGKFLRRICNMYE